MCECVCEKTRAVRGGGDGRGIQGLFLSFLSLVTKYLPLFNTYLLLFIDQSTLVINFVGISFCLLSSYFFLPFSSISSSFLADYFTIFSFPVYFPFYLPIISSFLCLSFLIPSFFCVFLLHCSRPQQHTVSWPSYPTRTLLIRYWSRIVISPQ